MFYQDSEGVVRCRPLERFPWLEHGFGTRHSTGWPAGERVASLRQVHSATSRIVHNQHGCAGDGDALITRDPGQFVSVRTADCLPLLLVCPAARVVAAVHAGWRGTAADIAGQTVRRLQREFQVEPAALEAAIGPGIGACCYEVGPEVLEQFREVLPDLPAAGKGMLDLVAANRQNLIEAGVPPTQIYTGAACTACHQENYFSYRESPGETGRMVSAIAIRPE